MATCDLTLVLDETDRVFRPGETVSGRVDLQTDGSIRIDALVLELGWQTHGKGNRAAGTAETVTLYEGEFDGLALRSFPFELPCPPGPFTYHGELLNVDWHVRARADVPWKIDANAEEQVVLEAPERETDGETGGIGPRAPEVLAGLGGLNAQPGEAIDASLTDEQKAQLDKTRKTMGIVGRAVLGCFLLPFLLVGLGLLVAGGFAMAAHFEAGGTLGTLGKDDWVPLAVGIFFTGLSSLFLAGSVSGWIASRRLGDVTLEVTEPVLLRGQTVEWRVALQPPEELELSAVRSRVVCRERVTRGSGTNRRTYTHDLVTRELDLSPARRLFRGQPFEVRGSFPLPADAPLSFRARDNSLEWEIECQVDVPKWPDWSESRPFVVVG